MPNVLYEKKGRIAYITLNRPEVLNAENSEMKQALKDTWIDFRDDPSVWVGIISGAGDKAFSAGSDVKELNGRQTTQIVPEPLETGSVDIWKPLIAAIQGWCVGGGLELVLACDIRIATEQAKFGLVEPKIGQIAGGGGTVRLPNQIPFAIAMEMILTADTINAQRAYEIGLINQVVPSLVELMPAAEKMAERILACSPIAVSVSKEQAIRGFSLPNSLALSLRYNRMDEITASNDTAEGSRAFIEKRKPIWKGN